MIRPVGWKKAFYITFVITSFIFLITQIPAMAFGPQVCDVTTKAFSVVWTTSGAYTSCDIKVYSDSALTKQITLASDQKIIETATGNTGQYGRQYGIAKVTVVGLNIDTPYYFKIYLNGSQVSTSVKSVRTEKLRGFISNDPNDTDIVSNDIVHRAVYKSDGTSPGIGALVLAAIFPYNSTTTPLSDYPISTWVGDGMIGDENSQEYDPNNISYKQYAALNMNNLFRKTDHYPLSLQGDDPATTSVNESEIVKFTIVHGTLGIFGQKTDQDYFNSYGRIESVDKINGEKISTEKISGTGYKLTKGLNCFAFPSNIILKEGKTVYTTGDLFQVIKAAGGDVIAIYANIKGDWERTYEASHPVLGKYLVKPDNPIPVGKGCYIFMKESMEDVLPTYGKSKPVGMNLSTGINVVSIPQLSVGYTTFNLLEDIEAAGAGENNVNVYFYNKGDWERTYKSYHPVLGMIPVKPEKMANYLFYYVLIKSTAGPVPENFNPFGGE